MQYSEPQLGRNNKAIYAVVLLKLVADSLLVLMAHHSVWVWELGLFGRLTDFYGEVRDVLVRIAGVEIGYPVFLIGGMVLSALLYVLTIEVVQIQGRLRYAAFALLYVMDSLFLLYPCREMLTVLLCILLLASLRRKDALRYVLAGLVTALMVILVSPYLLVILVLYLGVRAWERSSRIGFWVFLIMIAAFCILYESGMLLFLQSLRGESTEGARYFVKVFPPENYAGHVSYYLLDYLSVLARLMFPYEAFLQRNPLVYVFFFTQVGMLIWFVGALYLESETVHRNRRHCDRMRTDVMIAVAGILPALAFFVQDYVEAFRFVVSFYPLYLYLFFGTVWQPLALEKNPSAEDGALVFLHRGGERYVYDALRQACDVVSEEKVILLGDEANRGFCANWYALGETDRGLLGDYALLHAFMKEHSLHRVLVCAADLLVYENLCERTLSEDEWLLIASKDPVGAPAVVSYTDEQLESFLRFAEQSAETEELTALMLKWYEASESGEIRLVTPVEGEETIYIPELSVREKELMYDERLGMVKLHFKDGVPHAVSGDRELRVGAFRVSMHREDIPVLLDGSSSRIRYVCNRMMNK